MAGWQLCSRWGGGGISDHVGIVVYEPLKINGITAKNRLMVSPMRPRIGSPSTVVSEAEVQDYVEHAKTGAGIISWLILPL